MFRLCMQEATVMDCLPLLLLMFYADGPSLESKMHSRASSKKEDVAQL